jgi:Na+-driven multidrug efflux pump
MAKEAIRAVRIYFTGFIFAGINIVGAGYLSATESALWASITSIMRGFIAIIGCAFLLSSFLGMTGIWLAFPAGELLTMIVMVIALIRSAKKHQL